MVSLRVCGSSCSGIVPGVVLVSVRMIDGFMAIDPLRTIAIGSPLKDNLILPQLQLPTGMVMDRWLMMAF